MSKLKKALEKAKETRGLDGFGLSEDNRQVRLSGDIKTKRETDSRPELDIRYSETKIKKIDDSVLKKGKVISLFHDIEKVDQIKTLRTQILNHLKRSRWKQLTDHQRQSL